MAFNKNVRDVAARARYAVDLMGEFASAYEAGASRDIRVEIGGKEITAASAPGSSRASILPSNIPWGLLVVVGGVLFLASR